MIGSIITISLWLWILPALAGFWPMAILTGQELPPGKGRREADKEKFDISEKIILSWLAGQTLFWALFQLVAVPCILKERPFSNLVRMFGPLCLVLSVAGLVGLLLMAGRGKWSLKIKAGSRNKIHSTDKAGGANRGERILMGIFLFLLLFQLLQIFRLAYGDGDDAYYVAVSALAEEGDTMYRKLAYTGGTTQLDIRHGLAPFPIWVAFLVRMSGIPTAIVAHVGMPLLMIPMAYGVFYLIGRKICKERARLWGFMVLTEVLVLFGNYSLYTAESFLIARSRQGKAALGSMIFPFMLYLLILFLERLQEEGKMGWTLWIMLTALVTGACLCSTLGALLSCMLIGVAGLCTAMSYGRVRILFPLGTACLPALVYALLYIRMG